MPDVHDPQTRSYNMSQIKGKDTGPEMIVRNFLHSNGFRYRLHVKELPGRPDIVLKKYRTIIDVRGCFWHLHENCKYGDQVNTPSEVITSKRKSAVERDKTKTAKWKALGWQVIIIWSKCELEPRKKSSIQRKKTLGAVINKLENGNTSN